MPSFYLWLKLIHVIHSTVLFGSGIGSACVMLYSHNTRKINIIATITRYVIFDDWIFTTPSNDSAAEIAKSTTLKTENLSRNKIDGKGEKVFATNISLNTLNLEDNTIRGNGAIVLSKNTHLKSVNVEFNNGVFKY